MNCLDCVWYRDANNGYGECYFPGRNKGGQAQIFGMVDPKGSIPTWCLGAFEPKPVVKSSFDYEAMEREHDTDPR